MRNRLKRFSVILFVLLLVFTNTGTLTYGEEVPTEQETSSEYKIELKYPELPEVVAGGAILMDADTGAILYEKDAYSNYYPASITKIMTCLLAIENLSLDQEITFTDEVFAALPWDASLLGVVSGETLTVKDCLYGLMLRSGNEVAVALAMAVSGSEEEFGKLMTERAKEMGALSTVFTNASGLYQDTHYTTPYDMAVITREAIKNGTFAEVWGTDIYDMAATNICDAYTISNRHNMLVSGRDAYYQYAEGGKTGYEDLAKRTLVTHAKKDGMSLICVVMFDENDAYYPDTERLLEYGFNNFKKARIVDEENRFGSGGFVSISDTAYVTIPNDMKVSDIPYETIYNEDNSNGNIAQIKYSFDGHYLGESTLIFVEEENYDEGIVTPVKKDEVKEEKEENLYIDIGYIMAAVAAVLIITIVAIYMAKTKQSRKIKRDRKRLFKEEGRKYKIKKRRRN